MLDGGRRMNCTKENPCDFCKEHYDLIIWDGEEE